MTSFNEASIWRKALTLAWWQTRTARQHSLQWQKDGSSGNSSRLPSVLSICLADKQKPLRVVVMTSLENLWTPSSKIDCAMFSLHFHHRHIWGLPSGSSSMIGQGVTCEDISYWGDELCDGLSPSDNFPGGWFAILKWLYCSPKRLLPKTSWDRMCYFEKVQIANESCFSLYRIFIGLWDNRLNIKR